VKEKKTQKKTGKKRKPDKDEEKEEVADVSKKKKKRKKKSPKTTVIDLSRVFQCILLLRLFSVRKLCIITHSRPNSRLIPIQI